MSEIGTTPAPRIVPRRTSTARRMICQQRQGFVTRRVLFDPRPRPWLTIICIRIPTKPMRRKVGAQRAHRDSGMVRSGTRCEASNGPPRAHQTGRVPSRLRRVTSVMASGCEGIRKARGSCGLRSEVAPRAYGPSSSTGSSWRTGFFVLGEEGRCIRHYKRPNA